MQCFPAFIVETNKRFLLFFIQQEISKTCRRENLGFLHTFFSKTKRKTAKKKKQQQKKKKKKKKNAGQCISSNLTATSKNSGTFENKQEKVDFPLSIVFDQALQLKEMVIILMNVNGTMVHLFLSFGHNINIIVHLSISSTSLGFSSFKSNPLKPKLAKWALKSNTYVCKWF